MMMMMMMNQRMMGDNGDYVSIYWCYDNNDYCIVNSIRIQL